MEEEGHIIPYYTADNSSVAGHSSVQDLRDLNLTNQITKATFYVEMQANSILYTVCKYLGMHFLSSG